MIFRDRYSTVSKICFYRICKSEEKIAKRKYISIEGEAINQSSELRHRSCDFRARAATGD
jgi:hypothetical protein